MAHTRKIYLDDLPLPDAARKLEEFLREIG
jgi:hypothetical protein